MKGAMRRQVGSGSVYRPKKKLPDGRVTELSRYWIKYHKEGRPIREPAKTSNRKEAERLLKVRLGEIAAGTFRGLRIERIKIDELLDAVLRDYIGLMKRLFTSRKTPSTTTSDPISADAGRSESKPTTWTPMWNFAEATTKATVHIGED